MFGGASSSGTSSALGRSASFSFSQPPANKPFSGTSGGFTFGGTSSASTNPTIAATATAPAPAQPAAPAPTSTFSFGAAPKPTPTTSTTTTGGGLFGSTTSAQPQQQPGGLFGSSTTTQPAPSGGLFGSTALTQPQPQQQTGGLFGSVSSSQPPAQTGGLFGSTTWSQPQQQSGGLFGSSTTTQPAPSSGLFGSSTVTGNTGGGLFGASTAQAPKPSGFGLGASTTAPAVGTFGQSLAAFQPAQQQQQIAASPFARFGYYQKERFNDLPDDARKLVEELDSYITGQMQIKDELKTRDFGSEIRKCAAEWHELDSALKSLSATLESDANQCRDVAERVEQDRADNATLYAIASNAREGRSDGSGFIEWLQTYFAKLADEFRRRIQRYRSVMETIERHLQSLDKRDQYTPQAISDVIHAQHTSFMALATEVASLHSEVEALKKDYTKWYQQTHMSYRDPFGSMNQLTSSAAP